MPILPSYETVEIFVANLDVCAPAVDSGWRLPDYANEDRRGKPTAGSVLPKRLTIRVVDGSPLTPNKIVLQTHPCASPE